MNEREDTDIVERDLRAVDEALTTGSATETAPDARALQELGLLLRADAPEADPDFARRLRGHLDQGFGREGRRRLPRLTRRQGLAFGGAAASLLVAVAVAVSLQGGSEQSPDRVIDAARPLSRGGDLGSSAEVPPARSPDGPGAFEPGAPRQRVERTASLELAAPEDELERVADGVASVADRHDGFVLRSSLTTGDGGATGGSFELRIPSGRLRGAIRDLASLATVRSRTQSGEDVTREFATAGERLQVARAHRRSLLRRLGRADTDAEAEAIRRRLDVVAGEIRGLRSRIRDLRLRTDYATVAVSLVRESGDSGGAGELGDPDDALGDAAGSLAAAAGLTVRALGVAVPLGVLTALALLTGRAIRRRRREAALA
jgi:hypothetical protein